MNDRNIEEGLQSVARALRDLGNADANTPMGAIEALGVQIHDASNRIAEALESIAEAINHYPAPKGG